jgi:D-glycero-alpha-D-manno-heptose-7-phosphate kinase
MELSRPPNRTPLRIINAWAPIRVCDNGGWTDTWFARHGAVFNIAVSPGVGVQIAAYRRDAGAAQVILHPEDLGDPYAILPAGAFAGPHPLLEAAIAEVGVPARLAADITVHSEVPAGCSTGTSAAVMVALIGALRALNGAPLDPLEIASLAHRIEVERLGLQSGVQDQFAAACGGINFIQIDDYPHARVTPIPVSDAVWWELDDRLTLVFLGRTHRSSAVHERVIASLEQRGGASPALEALRGAAERSRAAVMAGDLEALGRAMIDNTAAQAELHADLVGPDARDVIALARDHGALGWKVNGAGGEGGSLTLLTGSSAARRRALVAAVAGMPRCRVIPTSLSRSGVRVWDACQP